jgi:hypothetical protein
MHMIWDVETSFRAKYRSWCKVHVCLDTLGNLLLLVAGMNMGYAQDYRGLPGSPGLVRVLVPIILTLLLWIARTAELMFFARRECARRQSAAEVGVFLWVLGMWVAALVLSQIDLGDADADRAASDTAAVLMWAGNLFALWRKAQRPLLKMLIPGPHLHLERSAVCNNMGFVAYRNNGARRARAARSRATRTRHVTRARPHHARVRAPRLHACAPAPRTRCAGSGAPHPPGQPSTSPPV